MVAVQGVASLDSIRSVIHLDSSNLGSFCESLINGGFIARENLIRALQIQSESRDGHCLAQIIDENNLAINPNQKFHHSLARLLSPKDKLGEFLVKKKFITRESLNLALQIQAKLASENPELLGRVIDKNKLAIDPTLTVEDFIKSLSESHWII